MTERDETRATRDAFAKLREADAKRAPPFDRMWRARPRRSVLWLIAPKAMAMTAIAAAACVVFWLARDRDAKQAVVSVAPPIARVALPPDPLAFLLESPTLASTPNFDSNPLREPR